MENPNVDKYGLLGQNISYSFSKKYFTDKFEQDNLNNSTYENFDVAEIEQLKSIIAKNPELRGLNITIPFKELVIPFLDKIDKKAFEIGAVNTIRITRDNKLVGYNTDYHGFKKSIQTYLKPNQKKALILGTGGASKAVFYALNDLNISCKFVSRNPTSDQLKYDDLNASVFNEYHIVINCTPLGTFPKVNEFPPLPYSLFTENHLAFDLIYNPAETSFLHKAKEFGALTINGYQMLIFQAEKSWKIWNQ